MRLLRALLAWQAERHQRRLREAYAPRLTAYEVFSRVAVIQPLTSRKVLAYKRTPAEVSKLRRATATVGDSTEAARSVYQTSPLPKIPNTLRHARRLGATSHQGRQDERKAR